MTDDAHTLSGAYALHALPEGEREAFEQHLEDCAACRDEVRDFEAVGAELATLVEEPPPAGLRATVLAATASTPAEIVQWATRELVGAQSRQDVVDVVLRAVQDLGGGVVRADEAPDEDAVIPLDIGFGSGPPLLAVAEPDTQARRDLERSLPQLVEDARHALETVQHTRRGVERPAGSGGTARA